MKRSFATAFTATASASASAGYTVKSANDAGSDERELRRAVDDVAAGIAANEAARCHQAVMSALTVIHRLNDRLREGTWALAGTTPDDLELWTAMIAPRNAAHHRSIGVTLLTSEADRLLWDAEVTGNTSKQGYAKRLYGKPVLPSLRDVARIAFGT